jgi:hypothetical protein
LTIRHRHPASFEVLNAATRILSRSFHYEVAIKSWPCPLATAARLTSGRQRARHYQRLTADRTAPVSAVHRSGIDIERMLHVYTADAQLDRQAAVTEGLSVRLSKKYVEAITQAVA